MLDIEQSQPDRSTAERIRAFFIPSGSDLESERKRLLATLVLFTGFAFMFSYALTSLIGREYIASLIEFGACALIGLVYFVLRQARQPDWIYRAFLFICMAMFLVLSWTSSGEGIRFIWAFTFPLLAYFIVGRLEGSIWNLVMLVGLLFALYFVPNVQGAELFSGQEIGRLFGAYILIIVLSFIFESVRQSFANRYFAERKLLSEEKQQLEHAHDEIKRLSLSDALTGAYNRGFLDDRLPFELRRARRYQHPISIIMIDLDHFKNVNDSYGHACGDEVLKTIVELCDGCTRSGIDWTARYGGEEFVTVLPETNTNGAMVAAERLRAVIENRPIQNEKSTFNITASLGVAGYNSWDTPADTSDTLTLLKTADERLYKAKNAGRNIAIGP